MYKKNSSAAGGSQSVEPGFRIYGKNNAVNEFNQIIKFKQKKRIPGQIPNSGKVNDGADFSFRANGTSQTSPRTY